jgi:hypothetical protein
MDRESYYIKIVKQDFDLQGTGVKFMDIVYESHEYVENFYFSYAHILLYPLYNPN